VSSPDQALDLFRHHAADWFHRPVADLPPLHIASEYPAWACYDDTDPEASGLLIDGSVSA